jgi:hypothetical protein
MPSKNRKTKKEKDNKRERKSGITRVLAQLTEITNLKVNTVVHFILFGAII